MGVNSAADWIGFGVRSLMHFLDLVGRRGGELLTSEMERKAIALGGYPKLLKEEVDSPPLSPRSDDDEETEPDDSDGDEEEEEEGSAGAGAGAGAAVVSGPPLKKGPWTPEEDKRLRTYVEAHGEGSWNQVQRNAGLNRCGKSCRLRWANHLRPHLKKGPFSPEEERIIIELHAMHGNKWAQMATKVDLMLLFRSSTLRMLRTT